MTIFITVQRENYVIIIIVPIHSCTADHSHIALMIYYFCKKYILSEVLTICKMYQQFQCYSRATFILLRASSCVATTVFDGSGYSRAVSDQRNVVSVVDTCSKYMNVVCLSMQQPAEINQNDHERRFSYLEVRTMNKEF